MNSQTYFLDAFVSKTTEGNPAAVVALQKWIDEREMQEIAHANNLAETAFFVPEGNKFGLRWFTPTSEVDLCGHATLATAHVIFKNLISSSDVIHFSTKSGVLAVSKDMDLLTLDLPGRRVAACRPTPVLLECFNKPPMMVLESGNGTYIAVFENEDEISHFKPDFNKISKIDRCLNITAPGNDCDFVSRFFGPNLGLGEDPVTGSAHCGLAIYWARRLNRSYPLHAKQLSQRGGELYCEVRGDRVRISGLVRYSF